MKDIPTSFQLMDAGKRLLFSAWRDIAALALELKFPNEDLDDSERLGEKEFWKIHRSSLEATLVLILGGAELLLKGKIAEKSPFLILKDSSQFDLKKSFLDCETIPAIKLIKVYEVVAGKALQQPFKSIFNELREQRNRIIHLGFSGAELDARKLLKNILIMTKALCNENWIEIYNAHISIPNHNSSGHMEETLSHLKFFPKSIELLDSAIVKEQLSIDSKSKSLHCPKCILHISHKYLYEGNGEVGDYWSVFQKSDKKSFFCVCCSQIISITPITCACQNGYSGENYLSCLGCLRQIVLSPTKKKPNKSAHRRHT